MSITEDEVNALKDWADYISRHDERWDEFDNLLDYLINTLAWFATHPEAQPETGKTKVGRKNHEWLSRIDPGFRVRSFFYSQGRVPPSERIGITKLVPRKPSLREVKGA